MPLWLIAGGLPPTFCMVLLNLHMYGNLLAPPSNLISPARGLFVFMLFCCYLCCRRYGVK